MRQRTQYYQACAAGFSLLELLVTLGIVMIVSVISVSTLYTGKTEIGGGERLLAGIANRVVERRAAAVRLNGEDVRLNLSQFNVEPLPMDLSDLSQSGAVITDGIDADKNCIDDVTGKSLTCLKINNGRALWSLAVTDDALVLPTGWNLYQGAADAVSLPLIGGGKDGRGVPVTKIGFDGEGRAYAMETGASNWSKEPSGTIISNQPSRDYAPFWAIYFYFASPAGTGGGRSGNAGGAPSAAVAIAVHPSGMIERYRLDGSSWIGFENRQAEGGAK